MLCVVYVWTINDQKVELQRSAMYLFAELMSLRGVIGMKLENRTGLCRSDHPRVG
jgi:hypothetical protein